MCIIYSLSCSIQTTVSHLGVQDLYKKSKIIGFLNANMNAIVNANIVNSGLSTFIVIG